jgi:hypothetical protein
LWTWQVERTALGLCPVASSGDLRVSAVGWLRFLCRKIAILWSRVLQPYWVISHYVVEVHCGDSDRWVTSLVAIEEEGRGCDVKTNFPVYR